MERVLAGELNLYAYKRSQFTLKNREVSDFFKATQLLVERQRFESSSVTVHLAALRRSLLLNQKFAGLGWLPVSPRDPLVSAGIVNVCHHSWLF